MLFTFRKKYTIMYLCNCKKFGGVLCWPSLLVLLCRFIG